MKTATKHLRRKSGARSPAGGGPVTLIIETPRGSRNKYKYDPALRMYKLSKVLPEGMVFPYDFGFVPDTKAEDGDPLDVLVLTDEPLVPGCAVDSALIGVIELEQDAEAGMTRNDRLVAVAQASVLYSEIRNIDRLNPVVLSQIESFFVNYQRVRKVRVKILGRQGPDRALEILSSSKKRRKQERRAA